MQLFFVLLAVVSGIGVWLTHGGQAVGQAALEAGWLLVGVAPIIVAALFIGGYVQALMPTELITRWLGESSGLRGYSVAAAAGIVTPGGPFAAFPLVLALRQGGASLDVCIVYVTAWATLGLNRIVVWEIPFLGTDFVILRLLASLPLPFVAGWTARAVARRER